MRAVFISDAHLRSDRGEGYHRVLRFLDSLAGTVEHLFIVGDFFDFWFCGNGHIYPPFQKPIEKILRLQRMGVTVHLFEGNHDFSLGPYFRSKGIEVYPDWADLTLEGQRFLISHGDTVDRANIRYLLLRSILRARFLFWVEERMPPGLLWKIAAASSSASKGLTLESQDVLAGKMKAFSLKKFEEGVDAVVLGHCHRPILQQYEVAGRKKVFVALGDWIDHFSFLVFEGGNFTLSFYNP
jgi:UDP-2,3-diacylglucosamine hydrolase